MLTQRSRAVSTALAVALAWVMVTVVCFGAALAGQRDTIKLTVPHLAPLTIDAKKPKVYNVTVSGFAAKKTGAYLFVDYTRCSTSYAVEAARAKKEGTRYRVTGAFVRVSGWYSFRSASDHACAYLVSLRTGRVLATASATFRVH